MDYAGKDATEAYEALHPPDFLDKYLSMEQHLGELEEQSSLIKSRSKDEERVQQEQERKPPLSGILSLGDIEVGAQFVRFRYS